MGGGSKTSSVTIPKWLEDAARGNIARAEDVSRIGYAPYYGPDVAGLTAGNKASMAGTNQMASAFGMPTYDATVGMPAEGNYNGMNAYSAGPMYDAAVEELRRRQPDTYAKLMAPFANQQTPAAPSGMTAALSGLAPRSESPSKAGYGGTGYGSAGSGSAARGNAGGSILPRDWTDGGGFGASGTSFSGGGTISALANALGVKPSAVKGR